MTKDCSVQYMKIPSSEHVVYINCSEHQNKKQFMYTTYSELGSFMYWTCDSILWVIWCKNKSFWQLITITESNSLLLAQLITNDPEGEFRRPPQSVLDSLAQANQHYKIGHLLCRSRSPDFLLDILQRQVNYKILWCPVFDDFCANVL